MQKTETQKLQREVNQQDDSIKALTTNLEIATASLKSSNALVAGLKQKILEEGQNLQEARAGAQALANTSDCTSCLALKQEVQKLHNVLQQANGVCSVLQQSAAENLKNCVKKENMLSMTLVQQLSPLLKPKH